ncbi:WXG100 family type VII secretion target [Clostridium felsineum]|uniref:WXG100 family type VII secretion target n=1 Tax=Clostridium felsineum TaxID=36839 RepID=UPI00098C78E3|nr:WXG100 family type VII secretion target [Clostridium felsineum]URZ03168.1 Type VII secretion system extracellular protein A [Clostridium felsineum]
MLRCDITPEELKSSAKIFKSKSDEIMSRISGLKTSVDICGATWQGLGRDAFENKYKTIEKDIRNIAKNLDHIAWELNKTADSLKQADEREKRNFRAIF